MRTSTLLVISIVLSGCYGSSGGPGSDACGCLGGWVCCSARQCVPAGASCPAPTPPATVDLAPPATPDMAPRPELAFNEATLVLPSVPVSFSSSATAHLTNLGSHTITIDTAQIISYVGDVNSSELSLATPSGCDHAVLAPGEWCGISVQFQPRVVGHANAVLNVNAPVSGGFVSVPLVGEGLAGTPALAPSPASLAFPDTHTGATNSISVTIVNNGDGGTGTLAATLGGTGKDAFTFSAGSCIGNHLIAGDRCTFDVSFAPKTTGAYSATLAIGDGGKAAATITIGGSGVDPAALSIATVPTFPSEWMGASSPPVTVHVSNGGADRSGPLTIAKLNTGASSFVIDGDGCSNQTLAGGTGCDVTVHFTADVRGSRVAFLKVSGTPGGAASTVLQGTALEHATLIVPANAGAFGTRSTAPSTLSFSVRNDGDELTPPLAFIVKNNGNFFFSSSGCNGQALAAHGSCTETILFNARYDGTWTDTLVITGAQGGDVIVPLSATLDVAAALSPSVSSLSAGTVTGPYYFPAVTFWNTRPSATGTLTTQVTGTGYSLLTDHCNGNPLAMGTTCDVVVAFSPTVTGTFAGTLVVGDGTNSATVALTADALVPALTFDPARLDFGGVGIGLSSAPLTVTVTNASNRPAPTASTVDNDAFWVVGGNCPDPLDPGASCTLQLRFGPRSAGSFSGNLWFNGTEGTPVLPLLGVGQ
jgi:hypothetical protein